MTTSIESVVGEFHRATGVQPLIEQDAESRQASVSLRMGLIQEEFKELMDELLDVFNCSGDITKVAKEMADVLYVVAGTADLMEIPLTRVFEEVHASNMSKVPADGKVLRRADGKILKPATYREPDLSFLTEAVAR